MGVFTGTKRALVILPGNISIFTKNLLSISSLIP